MKKIIGWVLLFLFLVSMGGAASYDATFLKKEITYTLHSDGSWVKDYCHRVRLDTYYAIRRLFGETFITYNPRYQELKIIKSETTMRGGKRVPSPENAFNEMLPFSAHYFPFFSHLRTMVITHTGLERGAVVDLHYQVITKPEFLPHFSAHEFMSGYFPVENFVLKITVPADVKLKYKVCHYDIKPVISEHDGRRNYMFNSKGIKPVMDEPFGNDYVDPAIIFSSKSSWDSLFPELGIKKRFPVEVTNRVKKIKKASKDKYEFYFNLQKFVSDEIQDCGIGIDLSGFNLRDNKEVFLSNYGTEIEKTNLLYLILNRLGISADILAVPLDEKFLKEVPSLFQVSRYLIKIKDGNDCFFLDPYKKQFNLFPYELAGIEVYNIQKRSFERLRHSGWDKNKIGISGKIVISRDKTEGDLYVSMAGSFNNYPSAVQNPGTLLKKTVGKIIQGLKKVDLKKTQVLMPDSFNVHIKIGGNFLTSVSDQAFLLKKFNFPYITEQMAFLKKRNNELVLDFPFQFSVDLEIKGADEMDVDFMAKEVIIKNEVGYYTQKVNHISDGKVYVQMRMGILKTKIKPEQYAMFKNILDAYLIGEPLMVLLFKK